MTRDARHDAANDSARRRIVWVYPDYLRAKRDSATTLQTTSALRNAGWRVDLLVGGRVATAQASDIGGIAVCEIPRPDIFLVKQVIYHVWVLRYVLREWSSIDVVFFASMSLPWMLLLRAARVFRSRPLSRYSVGPSGTGPRPLFVMDTRTMPMSRSTPRDYVKGLYTDAMNRLANHLVDGQTAITPGMADIYNVPSSKLLGCWPSGVDLDLFSPCSATRRWPQNDEPIEIVYVGHIARERDLIRLCEAVLAANLEGMRFRLSLIGDGQDAERLSAFAAGSDGAVRVMSQISHEKIPALLATMHVGALPFPDRVEFRVSSPIKLFEYMAAGMPVLATSVRCHTDVIRDRQCVFWAQDSSQQALLAALRRLWSERSLLPEYGIVAAEAAMDHSWAASADLLAQALDRGLARSGFRNL